MVQIISFLLLILTEPLPEAVDQACCGPAGRYCDMYQYIMTGGIFQQK